MFWSENWALLGRAFGGFVLVDVSWGFFRENIVVALDLGDPSRATLLTRLDLAFLLELRAPLSIRIPGCIADAGFLYHSSFARVSSFFVLLSSHSSF